MKSIFRHSNINLLLVASFGILVAILLAGHAAGCAWAELSSADAGGDGCAAPVYFDVVEASGDVSVDHAGSMQSISASDQIHRGEILKTTTGSRIALQLAGNNQRLFVDENTDLQIDRIANDEITLRLLRGRIYVDTQQTPSSSGNVRVTVTTNNTSTSFSFGQMSFVNYDFKQTIGIIPLHSAAAVLVGTDKAYVITKPVEIHETDPINITDTTFDPTTSAAADFYAWAMTIR